VNKMRVHHDDHGSVTVTTDGLSSPIIVFNSSEWEEVKALAVQEVVPGMKHINVALEGAYADLRREYDYMREKHGEKSIDGDETNDLERLAALVEEFGEVGEHLTYDKSREGLRRELLQQANVCVSWASIL
jgi:hypothetical protein